MNDIEISVVVTTYKRPVMVRDLVLSYLGQTGVRSELVILDDCVEDHETSEMIAPYLRDHPDIRFIKHTTNLGYSKNFLQSLKEARGKYIVTLGDDDILLGPHVLRKYVEVFEMYPKVGFIYSNILQFNEHYEMDWAYQHFPYDIHFASLADRLKHIWLKSCYIPGIGLRNTVDFSALYPKEDWLFPQVELIGKILGTAEAYGIGEYLIGGRAHNDQLGFEAVKGKRIKKNERHASLELLEIYKRVTTYYASQGGAEVPDESFIQDFFVESHASILPTEKINTGNRNLIRVFAQAVKKNPNMLVSPKYLFFMGLSLVLPRRALLSLKTAYKRFLVHRHWSREARMFEERLVLLGIRER